LSYCGYITKIKELRKHSNADKLQVATLFGNDVIVDLKVKVGDLGIYFPTDGRLGLEYAKTNKLLREKDENGNPTGGYLDPSKRHVKSLKLRGEKSDGLFMPIESLSSFCNIATLKEGDTVTIVNGVLICEKYIPKRKELSVSHGSSKVKDKRKATYPFFEEHLDTKQLAYNTNHFKEGDSCVVTLKLHGTSQRTAYTIKEKKSILQNIMSKFGVSSENRWDHVTGTRRVVLKDFKGGYYGGNEFRKQWHDFFKGKLHKGEEIYYEVVGYTDEGKLIMPECDNKKTKDKDFIKKYGKKTRFTYGCEEGKSDIYVYRMTMTNEDGHTVEYPWHLVKLRCEQMGVKHCPELERFEFTSVEDLLDRVDKFVDGTDPIGKTHIREGVIVRIENRNQFTAFKQKSFNFKVLEGIIKSQEILDMEEENSLV